ncbi:hypothetical protein FJZ18_02125 [Candidatus Pacearchaeota archaeon]|nr:hypothetical protein [Candidatus Pacearchaeota archaeon]
MKRSGKIFALLLLSLVLVSFISISLVVAEDEVADAARSAVASGASEATTVGERMFGPLAALFKGGAMSESTQLLITKLLLIFLVVIVVYAVAGFLPFFPDNQPGLKWAFSIVIGILAFIFVKPAEIKVLLTTYQALGIAVTTIIPLIIILTLTYKLSEKAPGVASIANKVILIIFLGYLFVQWGAMTAQPIKPNEDVPALLWLYPITALITLVWLLAEKWIERRMRKAERGAEQERAEETIDDAVGGARDLAKVHKELSKTRTKKFSKSYS